MVGPQPGNAPAPAPVQGGRVRAVEVVALHARVRSELVTALAGIISAYWSRATVELQFELSRGSARISSLHAALAVAASEGVEFNDVFERMRVWNESLRCDLSVQAAELGAIGAAAGLAVQVEVAEADRAATRARGQSLRSELVTAVAGLVARVAVAERGQGAARAESQSRRGELAAARAGLATQVAVAEKDQEAARAESQSLRSELAAARTRMAVAEEAQEAARAEVQSLRSELADAVAWAAVTEKGEEATWAELQSVRSELAVAEESQEAARAESQSLRSELAAAVAAAVAVAEEGQEAARAESQSLRGELAAAVAAAVATEVAATSKGAKRKTSIRRMARELASVRAKLVAAEDEVAKQGQLEMVLDRGNLGPEVGRSGAGAQVASDGELCLGDSVHRGLKRPRSPPGQVGATSRYSPPTGSFLGPFRSPHRRLVSVQVLTSSGTPLSSATCEYMAEEEQALEVVLANAVAVRDIGNTLRAAQARVREALGGNVGHDTATR